MLSKPSMGAGPQTRHWTTLSVNELADIVDGFGAAYAPYAVFVRDNGVDGSMVEACGGLEATLDLCDDPKPSVLHRRKFLLAVDLNESTASKPHSGNVGSASSHSSLSSSSSSSSASSSPADGAALPEAPTGLGVELGKWLLSPHDDDGSEAGLSDDLPESLRSFVPLMDVPWLKSLATASDVREAEIVRYAWRCISVQTV